MKRIYSTLFFLTITLAFVSCIKNRDTVYTDTKAEMDAASWNANAAGLTYPILTRIPAFNRVTTSSDSTLRRFSGTIRLRVNLNGPTFKSEQTVGYTAFQAPTLSTPNAISFPSTVLFSSPAGTPGRQEPAKPGASLPLLDAIAGTHYGSLSGMITVPADSSFGYIVIPILNPGSNTEARFVGIQLTDKGTIKPSLNYDRIGLVIDQR